LEDMGIESYLIADSVIGVIAQRLVRRLCPECKRECIATPEEMEMMDMPGETPIKMYRPRGCNKCDDTGYKGRIGVYEIMTVTQEQKYIISHKGGVDKIKEQALKDGMYTLHMAATEYVKEGITSYEEMVRISFDS